MTLAITSGGGAVDTVTTGAVVTLTATVMAGSTPVTVGHVEFCDATATYCEDIHIVGTAQLTSAGSAVVKFRPGVGSHRYKAVFVGTMTYAGSSSSVEALTVTPPTGLGATTTKLVYTAGGANQYSLTATVTATVGVTSPTGTLSFLDVSNGNSVLATAELGPGGPGWLNSTLTAGDSPRFLATADLNGDGIPDLAVTSESSDAVIILLGNGDGTFTQKPESPSLPGISGSQIVSGDFNGDGIPDLAVASGSIYTPETLSILQGNGDGTFTSKATYPFTRPGAPASIAVADFNQDGILDLIIPGLAAFWGNGDGTFTTTSVSPTGGAAAETAVADFNGDGIPDLAIINFTARTVAILLGNGDGTFTPTAVSPSTGQDPEGIVAADFNGDGIPDLAVSNYESSDATILLGRGDGTFTVSETPVDYIAPGPIAVADLNGDGIPDLVMSSILGSPMEVLLGNGDGTFTVSATYPDVSIQSSSLVVADFDGNGFLDLANACPYNTANDVSISLTFPAASVTETQADISIIGVGTYQVDASYPGDSTHSPSLSAPITLISPPETTNLSLSASPSSTLAGQPVALTATLSPYTSDGHSTSGETVTFYNGNNALGIGTLSGGVATLTTTSLPGGTDILSANYSGDTYLAGSISNQIAYAVSFAQPTLVLSVSPPASTQGQQVTVTATLSSPELAVTNGEAVAFQSNGTNIGTGTLVSGVASLNISSLALGADQLTASYAGDNYNLFANSNVVQESVRKVGQAETSLALAVTSSGSAVTTVAAGTPVILTVTVTAGGSPVTPGTVTFCDDAVNAKCGGLAVLGTAQLTSSGTAAITVHLGIGAHSLVALFAGTASEGPSIASPVALTVTGKYASVTTFTTESRGNGNQLLAASIQAKAPAGSPSATGTVQFIDQSFSNAVLTTDPVSLAFYRAAFFSSGTQSPATGTKPFSIAAADLNHDGIPDLAVANSGDGTVGILLGNGDGTLKTQTVYAAGSGAFALAAGDFNNDGNVDLAIANFSGNTVSVLLGNGDGTFQTQETYATGGGPDGIAVGDFNGDGILDLAVTNETDNTVSILLGKGDGTFAAHQTFATGGGPDALAAVDFNGDGYLDLAVANLSSNNVSVVMGKGDGTFQTQVTYTAGVSPSAVVAGNLSGQGQVDLGVVNSGDNTVTVLVNGGSGLFSASASKSYPVGGGPLSAAIADLNGDGMTDLAVLNTSGATVTVLLNGSGPQSGTVGTTIALPGTHLVDAVYSGDSNFSGSTSATFSVSDSAVVTGLTLTSGPTNPSNYGDPVTLTAILSPYSASDVSTNGDMVTFMSGSTVLGTGTLASGLATLTTSTLPVGTDPIQADFAGNSYFAASTSALFSQTVRPAALTVTGQQVSRAYGAPNPALTGTVSGAVNGDTFTVTATTTATTTSPVGAYPVKPVVSGAHLADYTVNAVNGTLTVTKAAPTLALLPSANSAFVSNAVTFTATLSLAAEAQKGTVSFYDGTALLGAVAVSSGKAAYTTSTLAAGSHSITAAYSGDADFAAATSGVVTVAIENFTIGINSGGTTSVTASPGGQAVYTFTVSPRSGATLAGPISFTVTGLPAGATAVFSPVTIPTGAGATTVTMTVTLPAKAAVLPLGRPFGGALPIALGLILLPFARRLRKGSWRLSRLIPLTALALVGAMGLSGCGGGSSGMGSQSQPQDYTLTITASSGSLSNTMTVSLTVE